MTESIKYLKLKNIIVSDKVKIMNLDILLKKLMWEEKEREKSDN